MSHRPLAIVSGLTIGDYLLWNWSLNANHDVLALVSGLTLPPLTIACVWLVALTAARLIARSSRSGGRDSAGGGVSAQPARTRRRGRHAIKRGQTAATGQTPQSPSVSTTSPRSSRKIAA